MALIIVGLSVMLASVLAVWAERTLVNSDTFSDRSLEALEEEEVRLVLRDALVDQVEEATDGELIAIRPLVEVAVDEAIKSDIFRDTAREGVRTVHSILIDRHANVLVLRLANLFEAVITFLETEDPELAAQIPDDLKDGVVQIRSDSETWARSSEEIVETVDAARLAAWALPALAGALIALGIWLAPRRRPALVLTGLAVVAGAVILFGGREGLRELMVDGSADPAGADAVRATYDVFTRNLVTWLIALGAAGLMIAAAGSTAGRPVDVRSQLGSVWTLATTAPDSQWGRVVRAGALVALAALVVFWLDLAAKVLVVVVALYAFYYGLTEFISLTGLVREETDEKSRAEQEPPTEARAAAGIRAAAVFGLIAVALAGLALVLTPWNWISGNDGNDATGSGIACNGHSELCDRRLNEVAFATTHNSMSAADEPGWFLAAQSGGIREQLEEGIRGFQIDTYYGVYEGGDTVFTVGQDKLESVLAEEFGEDLVADAEAIIDAVAPVDADEAEAELFLCHAYCELGYTPLVDALNQVREFLDANPNEVLVVFIEDSISGEDTESVFEESELIKYVYTHRGDTFPTLREMIDRDERVLVMSENDGGSPPWYHAGFELTQETHFRYESPEEMDCAPNRGQTDGPLFQLNHFISPPSTTASATVNEFDFLLSRARRCQEERGLMPNLVAVNYYRIGDVVDVVDALNGVGSAETR